MLLNRYMKEYVMNGMLNGEERKLLILHPMEGLYKVYWDAVYLGDIRPEIHDELGLYWDSDYEILQGCCQEIGEYIESCDS